VKKSSFNPTKARKLAEKNAELCANGSKQYVCQTGTKAKGHKTPATGTLPYVRRSVIG
jgi:hypothetical protein